MSKILDYFNNHPYYRAIVFLVTILSFIGGIIFGLISIFQNKSSNNLTTYGNNSPAISGDGNSVKYELTEIKQTPLNKTFKIKIENLRTTNTEMYNVKYILPLNKEAFVSQIKKGEEYVLFNTNDDLSDVSVSEKYKMSEDLQSHVCWIVRLYCDSSSCDNNIEFGPADSSCYKY